VDFLAAVAHKDPVSEDPLSSPAEGYSSTVRGVPDTANVFRGLDQDLGPSGGIGAALRALKSRIGKVLREAERGPVLKALPAEAGDEAEPGAQSSKTSGEPMRVTLFALPQEPCAAGSGAVDYTPADPLPPGPPPPLAPIFLVMAGGANHEASVERVEALVASLADAPLLAGERGRLFRADRVDVDLRDAIALRRCPEPGAAPFVLVQVRDIRFRSRRRPRRVTEDRGDPGTPLSPTEQMVETIRIALNDFVFEPNDADTWAAIRGMALGVLHAFWQEGHLTGSPAEGAYFANCGLGETMTAEDLLQGRIVLAVSCMLSDVPAGEDPWRSFTFETANDSG
jgi:hypothetical protein